jgi:NTE family protein
VQAPDTLVLGGGGILGEAWMLAVLAGIEQAGGFEARDCGCFIGTSAGSIVAAALAAGMTPAARLGDLGPLGADLGAADALRHDPSASSRSLPGAAPWDALARAVGLADAIAGPLASVALASTAAGGALLRRGLLRRVPPGRRSLGGLARLVDREGARWGDGRLLIVAVDERSGKRVAFGADDAPDVSVGTAVEASCAIPGFFRPVQAGGRSYVDGGVWSPTNIDLARSRAGDQVLCLNPTGSLRPTAGALAGAIGPVSRAIAATEARSLRGRGAAVRIVNPDRESAAAMGVNLMDPRRRAEVVRAGMAQGHAIGLEATRRAA